ncbi:hypothetical protein [Marvinbryantia sp.]|uniref:hypothetical protein n=1 Tax=Marvinbryantia sp. TaxID=2496532 RepID=UPI0025D7875A|nr:hypothetical protein [uncultured Marvinbryantia sp.]
MSVEGMRQETGPCAGTDKPITVRKQKLRKNHIKAKLIFFIALAVGLLLTAVFARQL